MSVPFDKRVQGTWKQVWPAYLTMWTVNFIAFALWKDGLAFETAALITTPFMLVTIFASIFIFVYSPKPFYRVEGILFTFIAHEYYVEPDKVKAFLDKHLASFAKYGKEYAFMPNIYEPLKNKSVIVSNEPIGSYAETEPWLGLTRINGAYILKEGVLDYEMKLHLCHYLNPGCPEERDIAWMKERNLL